MEIDLSDEEFVLPGELPDQQLTFALTLPGESQRTVGPSNLNVTAAADSSEWHCRASYWPFYLIDCHFESATDRRWSSSLQTRLKSEGSARKFWKICLSRQTEQF